ncbi:hypothetical protein DM01DRAFT_322362 [Hesseltinella vesiculosa]|uniref:F-box domain-containing protein n=1 Tax=Hesseltinella vesiculosa TaxID=101127 RepID=A0A1X2GVZ8_9FUNG|nr:hypothetical protein DM01DRAFT_322362 [Hesseltinella vesiculosa]
MLDNLPMELVQNITTWLHRTQDLAECMVVCRPWLRLFMLALYDNITLYGPPAFQKFIECLKLSSAHSIHTHHRHLVIRCLSLQDSNLTPAHLLYLAKACSRLEHLTIDGRAQWRSFTDDGNSNNWWPSLKSASLYTTSLAPALMTASAAHLTHLALRVMYDQALLMRVFNTLASTPNLQSFIIDECLVSTTALDRIHTTCPVLITLTVVHASLTSFSLDDKGLEIADSPAPLPSMPLAQPALQHLYLQEIDFTHQDGPAHWMRYLACETKLRCLTWWPKSHLVDAPPPNQPSTLFFLSTARQLERLEFYNVTLPRGLYEAFSTLPLTHLGVNHSLALVSSTNHHSLHHVTLWWNALELPSLYLTHLPRHLASLHLSGRTVSNVTFDLQGILTQCPRLATLHLDFGAIVTSSADPTNHPSRRMPHHPLSKLTLEEVQLPYTLVIVLARCRQLAHLVMIDCVWSPDDSAHQRVDGLAKDDPPPQVMRLDLPCHFHSLTISGLRFTSNPLLRAKTMAIHEHQRYPHQTHWYYFSHHATFLTYTTVHTHKFKLPVHAIKYHASPRQETPSRSWKVPVELQALRQLPRTPFDRDPPCAGFLLLTCLAVDRLCLENQNII